jgi:hypothetical protein
MRNANEALKVNKAVEKILAVFEEEKLSEGAVFRDGFIRKLRWQF